jgi:class 3 adenylate cyclase
VDRREERRLVACLFIDMVGSTELTMRLGSERLKAALGAAFNDLRELIEHEGGTVEKYIGDEIYALFGAPVAHEDDPARALRAADAARRWARERTGSDVPFDIRIGIETGEAVIDLAATEGSHQQMSVGAVVNVASRLCHQAEPGQILVGPVARAATDEIANLHAVGPIDLKGLGPTEAWLLEGIKGEASRRRLPFVGREGELELLRLAHRRARDRSVLALVSGPPGQGKTRLVEEFVASLADVRILTARCRPGGEIGALAPLRDILLGQRQDTALDQIVSEAVDDRTERARVREKLAHSAGLGASGALGSLGKAERDDEIQNAWRRFMKGLAMHRPVVLWIEDFHWAAPDVVRLLDRLSLCGEPFLMIATARPEFAESAGLRPGGDRFFIELEGLDPRAAQTLAESAGGTADYVLARAEGNPLFIVELARAHVSGGDLPLTLQGALGARLDELEPDVRVLLAHAAVVGETFTALDAATLARADTAMASRALARLADRHYLDPVDRGYRFRHSLLRDVAYGRLLVADRMRLHARYARELAASSDAEVLAYHWWAAVGGPDAEWVWRGEPELVAMRREAFAAHMKAGTGQAELFAVERAAPLLERAFALAADEHERGGAKLALADAYAFDLRGDDAWRAYREARAHFSSARNVPPDVYLGALKVRLRSGAFTNPPDAEEVTTLIRDADAAARISGEPAVLARTLVYGAFDNSDPSSASGDPERMSEALRLSEQADAVTRQEILGWYANDLIRTDQLVRAGELLDEIEALPVRENDLDRMERIRGRAIIALRSGDLWQLEQRASELVAMSRRMGPHLRTHADAYAGHVAFARGDWDRVLHLSAETERLMRSSSGTAFCSHADSLLAFGAVVHARAGRAEEAHALVRRILTSTDRDMAEALAALAIVFISATGDLRGGAVRYVAKGNRVNAQYEAIVAVASRSHDRALDIAQELEARSHQGARFFGALAEAVEEEVAHDRGGGRPAHGALREIGYVGWSELLSARP